MAKIEEARKHAGRVSERRVLDQKTPQKGGLRHLQWNIEWMDYFYKSSGVAFRDTNPGAEITDVPALCTKVASVIKSLDPDVIAVVRRNNLIFFFV